MKILFIILGLIFILISNINAAQAPKSLIWLDNSNNEEGFIIEMQRGNSGYTEIGRVGPNQNSFKIILRRNECYRIKAFNKWGVSAPSNIICGSNYV